MRSALYLLLLPMDGMRRSGAAAFAFLPPPKVALCAKAGGHQKKGGVHVVLIGRRRSECTFWCAIIWIFGREMNGG